MKNRFVRIVLGFALSVGAATAAADQTSFDFSPYTSSSVGSWAEAVAIGDVNGDRLDDVVLGTGFYFDENNDYHVFVYLQRKDGALAAPLKFRYAESTNQLDLELVDLDADGAKDIVVGHQGGLTVYMAGTNGDFTRQAFAAGRDCQVLAGLDVDADDHLDVICQSWGSDATIFYGDGKGGFDEPVLLASGARGYNDMKVGDVTGDGLPDLVITSQQATSFFVHPGNGQGGFHAEVAYPAPPTVWPPSAVAIGDFDGDDLNEVALVTYGNSPDSGLYIYHQTPTGQLDANPVRLDSYDIPAAMVARDLDKDGRTDLVVAHTGWFRIGRYMQTEHGLSTEALAPAPYNEMAQALAAGDFDDDGCSDVAIADHSAGLVTLSGIGCARRRVESDFNGDGIADLLWHNAVTGESEIWKSAESNAIQAVTRVNSTDWRIVATGDFDGDGRTDIVWHNQFTGAGTIWKSGNYGTQQGLTRITDPAWEIVDAGDYDGDGEDDLMWRHAVSGRNAIWKSGNYRTQQPVTTVTDVRWRVSGSGDLDGDGKDDIFWRHATSGGNAIWKGGNYRSQQPVTAITNVAWNIGAIGDFDGDGVDDLFWRHATGANTIWRSATYGRQVAVPKQATRWVLAAAADYDGNGKDDVIWRNTLDGSNLIWRAAASTVDRDVAPIADQTWIIP